MLKKILILNFIYFLCALTGFCNIEDKLSNLEYAKYGESFSYESAADRLNRLETDYFGMAQSGDIDSRINMLSTMSRNSKQIAMQNPYDNYYTGKQKSKLKNFWDNVTSTFDTTGTMTGYTPSVVTTSNGYNYGYPNNMYRNEFLNFMNNPNPYCPYHNRYHSNNNIVNRFFNNPNNRWNRNINNRYYNNPYHHYHNPYINNNLYNPYNTMNTYNPYNPYNRYSSRTTYNTPPNVATKSSVHIIKD